MQLVTVATFDNEAPAKILQDRLKQVGFDPQVKNETRLQRLWFLSRPLAGVHLKVPKAEHERATETVERWHAEDGALKDAIRCPECGSSRVEYPQMTRNFLLPTLLCHVLSLIGLFKPLFYCRKCQYTWSRTPGGNPPLFADQKKAA